MKKARPMRQVKVYLCLEEFERAFICMTNQTLAKKADNGDLVVEVVYPGKTRYMGFMVKKNPIKGRLEFYPEAAYQLLNLSHEKDRNRY